MEEILFVEIHRLLLIAVAPSPRLMGPLPSLLERDLPRDQRRQLPEGTFRGLRVLGY
jgi:hypothetical protein